jgi:putative ABC transport system permease protein
MDAVLLDLRQAARSLRRSRFFAGITVLTLGLGMGIVTAGFAVVHAVLLHPIVADQDRVVRVRKEDVARGGGPHPFAYPEFVSLREQTRTIECLAAINYADTWSVALTLGGTPSSVALTPVSLDFFEALQVGEPLRGRFFQAGDGLTGAETAVVASERFWRRAMGGDPALVGRRLSSPGDKLSLLVIGIAPTGFEYPLGTDLWVPIPRFFDGRDGRFDSSSRRFSLFELLGTMRPGVSREQARTELEVLHRQLSTTFPADYPPMRMVVEPLLHTVVGQGRPVLLFLFAAAGLVFVIAGVNVAALLLMRAAVRRKEMAVRVALGASRRRLAREVICESVLLSSAGSLLGLAVARVLLLVLQALQPQGVPRLEQAVLDVRVMGFCAVAALGWVLALGTAPVWGHQRLVVAPGSEAFDLSSRGGRGTRGLRAFTIAETAAAVVVAIAAGLLVRSFLQLQRIDRGFDARNVAMLQLILPERYSDASGRLAFYDELVRRLSSIPGVISASPDHTGPVIGSGGLRAPMVFEGQSPEEATRNPWASWEPVMPSYFRTLGISLVRGRAFDEADTQGGAPVAIVSETVARRYWPGQDPLGKRLRLTRDFPWLTVVGVAADVRYRELTRTWLTVYFPATQSFHFAPGYLAVRTASTAEELLPAIQQTIRTQEPQVVFYASDTLEALLARELSRPRTALAVTTVFTLLAIVLAAVGVFGVLSYEMTERRHELAIRSVVGASPPRIFRAVVGHSLAMGGAGVALGVLAASLATRFLGSLLFEVGPGDSTSFLVGAGLLLAVVVLASLVPARRAAGVDPAVLLRSQ